MNELIKLSNIMIWVRDKLLEDSRVVEAVKDFGGIFACHKNGLELSKNYDKSKCMFSIDNPDPDIKMRYLGEYGTLRCKFPYELIEKYWRSILFDESSPKRLKMTSDLINYYCCAFLKNISLKFGYSSYRKHFFSIITDKTDWNIRLPLLSPVSTLKKLDVDFLWICINKNQYFNYPYWDFKDKTIHFKPFMKIPFQWHVKSMLKFAGENGVKVFIYAGDENYTAEQFLERINLLKQTIKNFNK